uniref:Uncharacterized protein n=1 Tax=Guillardia theta TaxID=55529 RepID=A0A7S4PPT9_GUITH
MLHWDTAAAVVVVVAAAVVVGAVVLQVGGVETFKDVVVRCKLLGIQRAECSRGRERSWSSCCSVELHRVEGYVDSLGEQVDSSRVCSLPALQACPPFESCPSCFLVANTTVLPSEKILPKKSPDLRRNVRRPLYVPSIRCRVEFKEGS